MDTRHWLRICDGRESTARLRFCQPANHLQRRSRINVSKEVEKGEIAVEVNHIMFRGTEEPLASVYCLLG